jgi:hypothetical protein
MYNKKLNKIMKLKIKDKIILKADESDFENQELRRDCVNKIVTIKKIFYDKNNNIDTFFVEENKYEWTLENIVNKQETLEDASWKYNPLKKLDGEFLRHAFKEGAKWQAERSYSEEEVNNLLYRFLEHIGEKQKRTILNVVPNEWFEQFKKK